MTTKRRHEAEYLWQAEKAGLTEYAQCCPSLKSLYGEYVPYATARDLFVEMVYYGPEVFRYATAFKSIGGGRTEAASEGKLDRCGG